MHSQQCEYSHKLFIYIKSPWDEWNCRDEDAQRLARAQVDHRVGLLEWSAVWAHKGHKELKWTG